MQRTLREILGRDPEGLTPKEIAHKAPYRRDPDESVRLYMLAAERTDGDDALEYRAQAALVLAKTGRLDEAGPILERLLEEGYDDRLLGHIYFHLLDRSRRAGDKSGFARWFADAAGLIGRIHPHAEAELEWCTELGLWSEFGYVLGAIEHWRGRLPRKLTKRIAELRKLVPDHETARVEAVRLRVIREGARERAAMTPESVPPKPDEARAPLKDRAPSHALTRGLFLAITPEELRELRKCKRDKDRRAFVAELEESAPPGFRCDTDKAWRFLHLLLDDPRTSAPKIRLFFVKSIHRASYHCISLLEGENLQREAAAMTAIDERTLRARYETWSTIEFHYRLGVVETPSFEYLWHWCSRVREFLPRAVDTKRSVLFDADT